MKRTTLISAPILIALSLPALGLPALSLSAQEQEGDADGDEEYGTSGAEGMPFPWPDFLEIDPLPGEYRMTFTLEDFGFSGLDSGKDQTGLMGNEGEAEVEYFCLADVAERRDWLEELGNDSCTQRQFNHDGNSFDIVMQCPDESSGEQMTMRIFGEPTDHSIDLAMHMRSRFDGFSKMMIDMRIDVERVGECGGSRSDAG